MHWAWDLFTMAFVSAGAFFFFAGMLGMLRFSNTLSRLHALTKADNLGLGLIILGMLPQVDWPFGALKLGLVWVLTLAASAAASQLVARKIYKEDKP